MPDIATISTFFKTIKTTTDIAKAIKEVDLSLEKAELKLKIAGLMESLADIKIQAVGIQELIQEKDAEIKRLNILLESKENPQSEELREECIKILTLLSRTAKVL